MHTSQLCTVHRDELISICWIQKQENSQNLFNIWPTFVSTFEVRIQNRLSCSRRMIMTDAETVGCKKQWWMVVSLKGSQDCSSSFDGVGDQGETTRCNDHCTIWCSNINRNVKGHCHPKPIRAIAFLKP